MTLRAYQTRAIDDLRGKFAAGYRAPALVLPTGAGKTVVAAEVIRSAVARGGRVLFLVHRAELLTQSVAKLERAGVTDLRIIQAGSDLGSRRAPVAVASIPTVTRWIESGRPMPEASLVIPDECHHVVAKTWKRITDHYASSLIVGLTATPQRADGRSIGDVFDSIVVGSTVAELTALGHLVPCRVFAPPPDAVGSRELAQSPLEAYQRYAPESRAVIFCVSVQHAERVADEMNAGGVRTSVVHGDMPRADRASTLADLDAGRIDAVASIGVLTEGWDSPGVSTCILARRPQHTGLYLQMVGRVLRPSPGKTHATLIDLCGSVHDHGPPDMDRDYTLDGRGISKVDKEAIKQCVHCGAVFKLGPVTCPICGEALPRKTIELPTALGVELIDLAALPKLKPRSVTLSITAKFASKCKACGGRIAAGSQIYWNPADKAARHAVCGAQEVAA